MPSRPLGALAAALFVLPVATQALAQSPFAGTWRGTWTDRTTHQSGPVGFVIRPDGTIDGLVGNPGAPKPGPIAGMITPDGVANLAYTYDAGDTFFRAEGRLARGSNQLSGTLDFFTAQGARIGQGVFALALEGQSGQAQDTAPPAPEPAGADAATIPTGRYTCYTATGWMRTKPSLGSPGRTRLQPGQFNGYLWIYDAHHYANQKEDDRGTYDLVGDELVAKDGPFVRVGVEAHFIPHGLYNKPTIHIGWRDTPSIGSLCTQ